jgi:hypothetical protein
VDAQNSIWFLRWSFLQYLQFPWEYLWLIISCLFHPSEVSLHDKFLQNFGPAQNSYWYTMCFTNASISYSALAATLKQRKWINYATEQRFIVLALLPSLLLAIPVYPYGTWSSDHHILNAEVFHRDRIDIIAKK